jgi:hypothetical protein
VLWRGPDDRDGPDTDVYAGMGDTFVYADEHTMSDRPAMIVHDDYDAGEHIMSDVFVPLHGDEDVGDMDLTPP